LERRILNIFDDAGQRLEYLYMLRLEPQDYQLGVAYRPKPQSLEAWQAETDALIIVNGGYFRKENEAFLPDGLTVVDGKVMGSRYGSFAGMLVIRRSGPELRWLQQKPYDPEEPLLGALQSFPILVKPGGEIGFSEQHEDNKQARRTVIGQDTEGRILFLLAPEGWFTLHQLSAFLTFSDLDLDIALNLDGGPSSGLLLASPPEVIPADTLLPIVITVHDRGR
jgi:exopolysaccharide biosynthesis protein